MDQVSLDKDMVSDRISKIVDNLIQNNSVFQHLSKTELMQIFSDLVDKVTPEKIIFLDDEDLSDRVEGVMVTESLSRLLDDLTPEEMKIFEAAVEGKN